MMPLPRLRLLIPLWLALVLGLACSQFPLGGTPIPGPATVAAGITRTFVAGQGQSAGATPTAPASATVGPTATSPAAIASPTAPAEGQEGGAPPATQTAPPTVEGARPRLAPGQAANVERVNMLDASVGWAVGFPPNDPSRYIFRTTDGGLTWHDVSPPLPSGTQWAATAFFMDADRAWATFADAAAPPLTNAPAVVWRTEDAGQTWTAGQPLDLSDAEYSAPSDLLFVDALRGYLLTHVGAGMNHDYVMFFITSDSGDTWERVADPLSTSPTNLPMSCSKSGIGFLDPDQGWVTGDCHGVAPGVYFHRSTDAGRNWEPQPLPAPPGAADLFTNQTVGCGTYSLTVIPPQFVSVAVVCQDFVNSEVNAWLYRSNDAGETWEANPLPGRELFFLDPNLVWSVAEGDVNNPTAVRRLFRSDDGGQSWADITTVTWGAQFDFVDAITGWAVARAGEELAFVHTTDGGATWQIIEAVTG